MTPCQVLCWIFSMCPSRSFATWPCAPGARFLWTVLLVSLALWLLDVFSQWKVPAEIRRREWGQDIYFPFSLPAALMKDGFTPPPISTVLAGQPFLVAVTIPPPCPFRFLTPGSPRVPHSPLLVYFTSVDAFENTL